MNRCAAGMLVALVGLSVGLVASAHWTATIIARWLVGG